MTVITAHIGRGWKNGVQYKNGQAEIRIGCLKCVFTGTFV